MLFDNKILIDEVENLAEILKPWKDQLVIGGGVALIIYDMLLSQAQTGTVGTTDIDFLIPRRAIQQGDSQISSVLLHNGFEIKNKSLENPPVQSFTKQVSNIEIEVEFLTDNKSRKKDPVIEIENAGVNAQALSYIEMSLQEATPIKLANGEQILIVRPEAWVFHKGLTFRKRRVESKKYKDLYGIWFVLTQLGSTSTVAMKALQKLKTKHPAWAKAFNSNLSSWMADATPKDWAMLLAQDINTKLTETNFKKLILSI